MDMNISFQQNVKTAHQTRPLTDVYSMVSDEKIKTYTIRLNDKYKEGLTTGWQNGDKRLYQDDKSNFFPVAMFSLIDFDRHAKTDPTPSNHSGRINLDLDENTREELQQFRTHLSELPFIEFCALSVSGLTTGHLWANCLVEIPLEKPDKFGYSEKWLDELHKDYVQYLSDTLLHEYDIKVGSAKDLKPARYIGFDPEPYHNENAQPVTLKTLLGYKNTFLESKNKPKEPKEPNNGYTRTTSDEIRRTVLDVLEEYGAGLYSDRESCVNFMMACKFEGLSYDDVDRILSRSAGYNREGNVKIWEGLKPSGKKTFGSVVADAKKLDPELFKKRRKLNRATIKAENAGDKSAIEKLEDSEDLGVITRMSLAIEKRHKVRHNSLTGKVEVDGVPLDNDIFAQIYCRLADIGYKNQDMMTHVLRMLGLKKSYHPVKQYLKGLKWDKQKRFIREVADLFSDKDDLFYHILRKFMIGAIRKAFWGTQNPMLVMAGGQGIGKSNFVKWLCPIDNLYLDASIQPDSADSNLRLTDRWIWEVSELGATTRRQDVEALKAFLSREHVTVRRPYDRFDTDKQALASFVGTVNDDGVGFLTDSTGNRRFRVVHMTGIDWSYTKKIPIDQLWAEAYAYSLEGETSIMDEEVNQIINDRVKDFEYTDPIEDFIQKICVITQDKADFIQTTELLKALDHEGYRERNSRALSMSLSKSLKKLEVEKGRENGLRGYVGIKFCQPFS